MTDKSITPADPSLLRDIASGTTAEERFDTGRMEPGDETTLVLTEPGEIPYVDLEDEAHEGTLTVVPAAEDG